MLKEQAQTSIHRTPLDLAYHLANCMEENVANIKAISSLIRGFPFDELPDGGYAEIAHFLSNAIDERADSIEAARKEIRRIVGDLSNKPAGVVA